MMANVWYAAWLGSDGPGGDRARLRRELDRLHEMKVSSVRILASSEGCLDTSPICPWSMTPAMQVAPGKYDHHLLVGLDFTIMELEKRGMVGVLILNSMMPASGGIAQYVEWAGGPAAPAPTPDALAKGAAAWNKLRFFTQASRFFDMPKAVQFSQNHARFLLSRRNSFTGRLYGHDPTIMSWELANAPRSMGRLLPYRQWVASTAKLVKRLAPKHLVTIGSEGAHAALAEDWKGKALPRYGWQPDVSDFELDHKIEGIDYATCQLWVEPWGWHNQTAEGDSGLPRGIERARQYLAAHVNAAVRIGMPLVVSEVGFGRDGGRFAATADVKRRNLLLDAIFKEAQASVSKRDALAGVGFSGWSGEGRVSWRAGALPIWHPGDKLLADSRSDPQGLFSVYDKDASTIRLIRSYAERWSQPKPKRE